MENGPLPEQAPEHQGRRKRRSPAELLEAARQVEGKALERAARKRRQVQKYESVQKARTRKLDTRRKIIVGALAWERRDHDGYFKRALMKLLDDYVLKDEERALVGLDPLPPEELARLLAERDLAKGRRRVREAIRTTPGTN